MGSKVHLIDYLKADELYHRYRVEQDPIKRTHLRIIWLLTSGRPATMAAEMTGYSQRWISVSVGRGSVSARSKGSSWVSGCWIWCQARAMQFCRSDLSLPA